MKIAAVEAIPFVIPLRKAARFGAGTMTAAEHVLVRIMTDEGAVGCAEAPAREMIYGDSQAGIQQAVERWFGPAIIGADPLRIEEVLARMNGIRGNIVAKSAIDVACHDIIGQVFGVPCYVLLGGFTNRVRITYQTDYGTKEEILGQMQSARDQLGISSFKLKLGADIEADLEVIAEARQEFPEAIIYGDANQTYSFRDAARMCKAGEDARLEWFEEPMSAVGRQARTRLGVMSVVPVLGDESCTTVEAASRELLSGAVHGLSVKVARSGYRTSAKLVALAESFGGTALVGAQGDLGLGAVASAHLAVALPLLASCPCEASFFTKFEGDIVSEAPHIEGGWMVLSDSPGLGMPIDESQLARWRV